MFLQALLRRGQIGFRVAKEIVRRAASTRPDDLFLDTGDSDFTLLLFVEVRLVDDDDVHLLRSDVHVVRVLTIVRLEKRRMTSEKGALRSLVIQ